MLKENKPIVSEVNDLSEVVGDKPNFLFVGEVTDEVTQLATAKKAHLNFFWVKSLEGQTEGSLNLVENNAVVSSTTTKFEDFVNVNAYPLVGQLTPEN